MADFRPELEKPMASPFRPESPVVDTSPADALQSLGGIASGLAGAANRRGEERSIRTMDDYTQRQLKYVKAFEQGKMNEETVRLRMRKDFASALANNPGAFEELKKRQDYVFETSGLGDLGSQAIQEATQEVKMQRETMDAGWAFPTDSPAQVEQATRDYFANKKAQQELQELAAEASRQAAKTNQSAAELALVRTRYKEKSETALFNYATTYTPKFQKDLQAVMERVGKDMDKAQAIELINQEWGRVESQARLVGNRAGDESIVNLTFGMKRMYENTIKHLNGEISLDILNKENEKAIALSTREFLKDPINRDVVAVSRLLPHNQTVQMMQGLNQYTTDLMRRNTSETGKVAELLTSDPKEKKDVEFYLGTIKNSIDANKRGGLDYEGVSQLDTNINNILKGISAYSQAAEGPEDYTSVVNFLASDQFADWTMSKGGIPSDYEEQLRETLSEQYENKVVPMLKREFEQSTRSTFTTTMSPYERTKTKSTKNVVDMVEPRFRGTGVYFEPKGESTPEKRAIANNLNNKVAKVTNRLIHMGAHLGGHKDYKRVYEENYSRIFGVEPPAGNGSEGATPE